MEASVDGKKLLPSEEVDGSLPLVFQYRHSQRTTCFSKGNLKSCVKMLHRPFSCVGSSKGLFLNIPLELPPKEGQRLLFSFHQKLLSFRLNQS